MRRKRLRGLMISTVCQTLRYQSGDWKISHSWQLIYFINLFITFGRRVLKDFSGHAAGNFPATQAFLSIL